MKDQDADDLAMWRKKLASAENDGVGCSGSLMESDHKLKFFHLTSFSSSNMVEFKSRTVAVPGYVCAALLNHRLTHPIYNNILIQ